MIGCAYALGLSLGPLYRAGLLALVSQMTKLNDGGEDGVGRGPQLENSPQLVSEL